MSESYPFDATFERAVVALLVTSDRFYNLVGPHLDPARFTDAKAQLIAAEAKALYDQIGKAPGSSVVILQRLRVQHDRGKVTAAKLAACADYLCDAEDAGLPDVDVAVHQVADVLRRVEHQAALDQAFTTFAERGDMRAVAKRIEVVESIGKHDVSYGATFEGFAEELEQRGAVERMSCGFRDLDVELDGGIPRGEFWFWLAGQKVGKSMALVQNAVIALSLGFHVAVATLELDVDKWRARVLGGLTGTPYQDILKYTSKSVAFERYAALKADPDINLGLFSIHKFGGHQTKLVEVTDWMKREEDRSGRKVDAFICDYADKLQGHDTKLGMYEQMRDVYEGIRLWAVDNYAWALSASQASDRLPLGEMPTANHCADSQHKARVTDGMIGITRQPKDENKVSAKVLAVRNGPGEGAEAGPLPNGFEYGCFVANAAIGLRADEIEAALQAGRDEDLGIFA